MSFGKVCFIIKKQNQYCLSALIYMMCFLQAIYVVLFYVYVTNEFKGLMAFHT